MILNQIYSYLLELPYIGWLKQQKKYRLSSGGQNVTWLENDFLYLQPNELLIF